MKTIYKYLEWAGSLEGDNRIYRGLADKSWNANSSLERKLGEGAGFAAMLEDTQKTLAKAKEEGSHIIKDDEKLSDLEMLACLQHYSVETFLIDFTNNPLIALWFACQDKNVDGKIISVDANDTEKFTQVSGMAMKEDVAYFAEENKLYKLTPSVDLSERIATQNSVFIFGAKGITVDVYNEFPIEKEEKEETLAILRKNFGTHEKTVFPDFTSYLRFHARLYDFIGGYHLESGIRASSQGEVYKAIGNFNKAIEIAPDNANAYNNRGIVNHIVKKYDQALADYKRALELAPDSAGVYYNRGITYINQKEYHNAISDFSEAIELDPNNANAYNNRGTVYSDIKEHDRAIADYNKALDLNPNFGYTYYNRGKYYAEIGSFDKAIDDLNKAIEIYPGHVHAHSVRGRCHAEMGDFYNAANDLGRAILLGPNDYSVYNSCGIVYAIQKRYNDAINEFSKAIKIDSSNFAAYSGRGRCYGEKGDFDNAIDDFTQVIKLEPDNANAYYGRGVAYGNKGDYDKAIENFNKAIELDPNQASVYHNRAMAREASGDAEGAKEDFAKAREIGLQLPPEQE